MDTGIYSDYMDLYGTYQLDKIMALTLDPKYMKAGNVIKTPKNSWVPAVYTTSIGFTNAEIKQINNSFAKRSPKAKLISNPSPKYNGHSYAWYRQSI